MQNRRPVDVKLAGYGPDDLVAWEVCTLTITLLTL
jgi:hypothetical protein